MIAIVVNNLLQISKTVVLACLLCLHFDMYTTLNFLVAASCQPKKN